MNQKKRPPAPCACEYVNNGFALWTQLSLVTPFPFFLRLSSDQPTKKVLAFSNKKERRKETTQLNLCFHIN